MTAQGKKRGPKPKIWKLAKLGKKFASDVLFFKFEPHLVRGRAAPIRGHTAAIRKVLKLREYAFLKQRYPNIDAADQKLKKKAFRYLEKKFQEVLAFWYPPSKEYPHPKANRANYRNKRIRGTHSELEEHNLGR
jgi:hypothetical protein